MSGFPIQPRKHIDGIIGLGLLLPYFFWMVPNMQRDSDISAVVAMQTQWIVIGLMLTAIVVSWFRLIKPMRNNEYRIMLLILAPGVAVASFILGLLARDIYFAIIISVLLTYGIMHIRCTTLQRLGY